MNEQELVERLQKKDAEAFDEFYRSYSAQAYRTAYFMLGSREDAEDVVQEAFVQVYLNIHRLRDPAGFRSWFYRSLTRLAWRKGRTSRREIPDEDIALHADRESSGDSLTDLLQKEERDCIRMAVQRLDEKHRSIVVLYYYNEFSTKQIARITGCLEGTVKSRLYTARKRLERILQQETSEGKYMERIPDRSRA